MFRKLGTYCLKNRLSIFFTFRRETNKKRRIKLINIFLFRHRTIFKQCHVSKKLLKFNSLFNNGKDTRSFLLQKDVLIRFYSVCVNYFDSLKTHEYSNHRYY